MLLSKSGDSAPSCDFWRVPNILWEGTSYIGPPVTHTKHLQTFSQQALFGALYGVWNDLPNHQTPTLPPIRLRSPEPTHALEQALDHGLEDWHLESQVVHRKMGTVVPVCCSGHESFFFFLSWVFGRVQVLGNSARRFGVRSWWKDDGSYRNRFCSKTGWRTLVAAVLP